MGYIPLSLSIVAHIELWDMKHKYDSIAHDSMHMGDEGNPNS